MTRAERRLRRNKKVMQRLSLMSDLGQQMGTLYTRHIEKINKNGGYMAKGNLRHYASCKPRRKYNRYENNKYGLTYDYTDEVEGV